MSDVRLQTSAVEREQYIAQRAAYHCTQAYRYRIWVIMALSLWAYIVAGSVLPWDDAHASYRVAAAHSVLALGLIYMTWFGHHMERDGVERWKREANA